MAAPRFDDLLKEEGAEPIAEPAAPRFDALLAEEGAEPLAPPAPPAPPPEPKSALRQGAGDLMSGVEQGFTFGFADELGGLQQATADVVSRGLPRFVNDALGIETRYQKPLLKSGGDLLDIYRQGRNENRAEYAKAKERSPYLYGAGSFAGGMAAPGGAGKSISKAMKSGGAFGALEGMGSSEADLTKLDAGNSVRFLLDTALGGVGGVGGGAASHGIQKYVAPAVKRAGEHLYKKGVEKAGKFLTGGVTSIDPKKAIDPSVATEALESGAVPYLGTIDKARERLSETVKQVDQDRLGLLDSAEDLGIEARFKPLIEELRRKGYQVEQDSANAARERVWYDLADLLEKRAKRDRRTGRLQSLDDAKLALKRLEGFKTDITDQIDWKTRNERPINIERKGAAATVREHTERALDQAAKKAGPESFEAGLSSEFRPIKQRLGRLLDAEEFALDAAEKAARKPEKSFVKASDVLSWLGNVPAVGPVVRAGQHLLETRGPSTGARFNYDLGKALQALSGNPDALGRAATRTISSSGRTAVPAVPDEFWERFVPPPPPPAETEEERRIRELRETLYPHGNPP